MSDKFRWSMWKGDEEINFICSPNKDEVWELFLAASEEIYGKSHRWYYENLGYKVKESRVWRAAHASK